MLNRVIVRGGRPYSPATLKEFCLLPHVGEALKDLRRAGFLLIVVTNQPDVGARKQRRSAVEAIHAYLRSAVAVDEIKTCYHIDEDGCPCRKPKAGMLLSAALDFSIDLKKSFMVGDRWRDIEAGKSAGCRTIWIRTDYKEKKPENPDAVCGSLSEASGMILSGKWARKGMRSCVALKK